MSEGWSVGRLVEQLHDLGVEPGGNLFVHTGLRRTRLGRGDVPHLFEAFRQVITDDGALYFPAHTYSFKGARGWPIFEPDAPCSPLIGMWPELARRQPGVQRSLHPTHSVAGIGRGVDRILEGHEFVPAAGFGSPHAKLYEEGCQVLLIGCGFESCTALHLAETLAEAPYLEMPYVGYEAVGLVWQNDETHELPLIQVPGCSAGFPKMEGALRRAGVVRDGAVASASAMICSMRPLVDAAARCFRAHPLGYLCDVCQHCQYVHVTHRSGYMP